MYIHLIIAIIVLTCEVAANKYYVAEDADCKLVADGECHSLSFYVNRQSSYFTNDTVFFFKGNTHFLNSTNDVQLKLTGIANISLIGMNNVLINCGNFTRCITIEYGTTIKITNIGINKDVSFIKL